MEYGGRVYRLIAPKDTLNRGLKSPEIASTVAPTRAVVEGEPDGGSRSLIARHRVRGQAKWKVPAPYAARTDVRPPRGDAVIAPKPCKQARSRAVPLSAQRPKPWPRVEAPCADQG